MSHFLCFHSRVEIWAWVTLILFDPVTPYTYCRIAHAKCAYLSFKASCFGSSPIPALQTLGSTSATGGEAEPKSHGDGPDSNPFEHPGNLCRIYLCDPPAAPLYPALASHGPCSVSCVPLEGAAASVNSIPVLHVKWAGLSGKLRPLRLSVGREIASYYLLLLC